MLNLIFDLDQTLIESINTDDSKIVIGNIKGVEFFHMMYFQKKQKSKKRKKRKKSKKRKSIERIQNNYVVFQRQYLSTFLRFCFNNFNVGFWSNGTVKYTNAILKKILLPEELKKCICILGRTKMDDNEMVYKDLKNKRKFKIKTTNSNYSKKLEYIYNKKITKNNTLFFDDGIYNKGMNCNNVVLIPEYRYNIPNDKCLFKLMEILKKKRKVKTIQKLNIKTIEDKLFKDYKKAKINIEIKKKYKVNDVVDVENINALNGEIVITNVTKNNYAIMYVDENTKMIIIKKIPKEKINYRWKLN